MKAVIAVLTALAASPAFADGAYIGGFGSLGSYQALGWRGGPNPQRSSTMLGGFAGYGFQAGGFIFSPEARKPESTSERTVKHNMMSIYRTTSCPSQRSITTHLERRWRPLWV